MATPAEVRARDQDRCAMPSRMRQPWRAGPCGGGLHVHHRVRRSQGGTMDSSNLITLCFTHHRWVHDHPMASLAAGLLLGRGDDPAAIAVEHVLWPAGRVWLGHDLDFILWHEELAEPAPLPRHGR